MLNHKKKKHRAVIYVDALQVALWCHSLPDLVTPYSLAMKDNDQETTLDKGKT